MSTTSIDRWSADSLAATHAAVAGIRQRPKVTICPPAPPREDLGWKQRPAKKWLPVSPAHATADGMESNGLEFSDLAGFSFENHKANGNGGRRLDIPDWALDNKKLSFVLAAWIENRALIKNPGKGTTAERIALAQARLTADRPRLISILDGMCAQLVQAKACPTSDAAQVALLMQKIQEIDSRLRVEENAVKFAFTVINGYYEEGKNSSEIAADLGMGHAHIRQTLWRLHQSAARHQTFRRPFHISISINLLRGLNQNPLLVPAKGQRQCFVCGIFFSPAHRNHKVCGNRTCRKRAEAKARQKRAAKKYFCGSACKDAARFAIKSLPVLTKPGVGTYAPLPGADPYSRYADFCRVVGSAPLTREQWANGLR
jgi:hypothetical protein